jgi:hypothetical protein
LFPKIRILPRFCDGKFIFAVDIAHAFDAGMLPIVTQGRATNCFDSAKVPESLKHALEIDGPRAKDLQDSWKAAFGEEEMKQIKMVLGFSDDVVDGQHGHDMIPRYLDLTNMVAPYFPI